VPRSSVSFMEDRAETLHRRIAAHRCYLAVGSDIQTVRLILREIAMNETELTMIEQKALKPDAPPPRELRVEVITCASKPSPFRWVIYDGDEPVAVKLSQGTYWSQEMARKAGNIALKHILEHG
jgi:hypothetical protein